MFIDELKELARIDKERQNDIDVRVSGHNVEPRYLDHAHVGRAGRERVTHFDSLGADELTRQPFNSFSSAFDT